MARSQRRLAEAEANYRKALDIFLEFGDQYSSAGVYYHFGNLSQEQERFSDAEANYRKALDIFQELEPRAASFTASQLGIVLAKLGRHRDATGILLYAAASWRQESGRWDPGDIQLLQQERAFVGSAEFTALIEANVPADLASHFTAALEA